MPLSPLMQRLEAVYQHWFKQAEATLKTRLSLHQLDRNIFPACLLFVISQEENGNKVEIGFGAELFHSEPAGPKILVQVFRRTYFLTEGYVQEDADISLYGESPEELDPDAYYEAFGPLKTIAKACQAGKRV